MKEKDLNVCPTCGDKKKSLGTKLGEFFAASVCACLTALLVAVTVRIVIWILL